MRIGSSTKRYVEPRLEDLCEDSGAAAPFHRISERCGRGYCPGSVENDPLELGGPPTGAADWSVEGRLSARTAFKRQPDYLRAPLSCFFNPLRLPVGLFMRFTNSAVVSSGFSRLGLDRTIVACSLCLFDKNQLIRISALTSGAYPPGISDGFKRRCSPSIQRTGFSSLLE